MAESRSYRIYTLDVTQLNWVLSQVADRLDAIEGYRGEPTFYSDVTAKTKFQYKDENGTILHSMGE